MMLVDQSQSPSSSSFNHSYLHLPLAPSSTSSLHDVDYSCGTCGFELNLSSNNRNTSVIGTTLYGKSIKRGIISFFSIDETRFTLMEQLRCKPYFVSARSWGLFQRRVKLLCKRCGNHLGTAQGPAGPSPRSLKRKQRSAPTWGWDGISGVAPTYEIRIRAVQPSSKNSSIFNMI